MKNAMLSRGLSALVLCLLPLLLVPGARATEGPALSVRLLEFPAPARSGESLDLEFEIRAYEDGDLQLEPVRGEGWAVAQPKTPPASALAKDESTRLRFQAFCTRSDEPIVVEGTWNGRPFRRHFDLSPAAWALSQGPAPVQRFDDAAPVATKAEHRLPGPAKADTTFDVEWVEEEDNTVAKRARSIRVRGRFAYYRTDGVLLGADGATVRIYDADNGPDELQATTVTDYNGNFDVTFTWDPCFICDSQPDIYAQVRLANTEVTMENTSGSTYVYETSTYGDYTGSDLNLNTFGPADEGQYPGVHIFSNLTRSWRWLEARGYDQSQVTGVWPDGTGWGAYYTSGAKEIHVTGGAGSSEWDESVHIHEYGHHFVHTHSAGGVLDYCNGICDQSATDCGHCLWCNETGQDAWNEGGPDWLGDTVADAYAASYGVGAWAAYDFESTRGCNQVDGLLDNPFVTEGFFAALLLDIEDGANEDDANFAGFSDRLSAGTNEILTVMTVDDPQSPSAFIQAFRNRYPSMREDLWETAMNNGYTNIDSGAPSAVASLTSSSHTVGVDSPDATIRFTWVAAADDFSGIEGYAVSVSANSPSTPSPTVDVPGHLTSYTTPPLAPGSYYFNVRAVDRDGNLGSVRSTGPYVVREALPANLAFDTNPGWYDFIVPRPTNDAAPSSLPAPTTLEGNTASTYWNLRVQNVGETSVPCCAQVWVKADGRTFLDLLGPTDYYDTIAGLGPNTADNALNQGPLELTGGRHTFGAEIDYLGVVAESNENDNHWARQWVWSPLPIVPGGLETRPAPPDRDGEWEAASGGLYYNCDGIRFSSSGWWNAVYVIPNDFDDDYDARLHGASTGPTNGFATNVGYSSRGAGSLDAVFVNRNVTGSIADWDVGVIQADASTPDNGTYRVEHVQSSLFNVGTPLQTSLPANDYLAMHEFNVPAGSEGDWWITVDVDAAAAPLYGVWLAQDFGTGDLHDYDAWATQDGDGRLELLVNIPTAGYHCLALYRDPKDGGGTSNLPMTIRIQPAPTDFAPYFAAGWHSPVVPRPTPDGTFSSVPLPTNLAGNATSTYINLATENLTTGSGTDFYQARLFVDGLFTVGYGLPTAAGNQKFTTNSSNPIVVSGGRHTLSVVADALDNYVEISETNNRYGEQYVWSPAALATGGVLTRAQPRDRTGGWSDVPSGTPLWFNCDGLRTSNTAPPSGDERWWTAVAVMPTAGGDVDVRLHEVETDAKSGFASVLSVSSEGADRSDFVIANHSNTSYRAFDAGVLDYAGSSGYTVEHAQSSFLASSPQGTYGGFQIEAGRIVDLHDVWLPAGRLFLELVSEDGNANLGMTLHDQGTVYGRKTLGYDSESVAAQFPAGQTETIVVNVDVAGYYLISVWKEGPADLAQAESYSLAFNLSTAVGDVPSVARTGLASVHPNPFNPRTTVAFDLREEGRVTLEIYSLRGELVRRLIDERHAPGRHEVVWNGMDDSGRFVASGTYLLRMHAGGVAQSRKLTLLK